MVAGEIPATLSCKERFFMKILFVSLGCDKNLVDTGMMFGMLREKGYDFTDDETEADIPRC